MGLLEDFEKFKRDRSAMADQDKGDLGFAIWEAASLASAEKVKAEAARLCDSSLIDRPSAYEKAAVGKCRKAVMAIDVKKLLEGGDITAKVAA